MNDHLLSHHRRPVVIADSRLSAGAASTRVQPDDPEALLRQYLRLIRRVRNQERSRTIALRRVDIAALAGHLGWTDDEVVERLADLMGITQGQRNRMLTVLATGAGLITIASPWAGAAAAADSPLSPSDAPVVVVADHLGEGERPSAAHSARVTLSNESGSRPSAASHADRHAPVLEAQYRRADSAVPEASVARNPDGPGHVTPQHGFDTDGNTVAVGEPPVPAVDTSSAPESGIDTDGNTVAVGEPPTPPENTPATDELAAATDTPAPPPSAPPPSEAAPPETGIDTDGNLVAVGEPPVPTPITPTPPETGIDTDGNTVAVGQPPAPPDASFEDPDDSTATDDT